MIVFGKEEGGEELTKKELNDEVEELIKSLKNDKEELDIHDFKEFFKNFLGPDNLN
jgi:hypothetical protein